MKRIVLTVAAIALFLATAALPSMADGNPENRCSILACPQ